MSRIARLAVLITALTSLFAVLSSTAGAVTWTNTGSTTIHATSGTGQLHVGTNTLTCTGATATATAVGDFTGTTYAVPGTVTFSPCHIAGQAMYIHCGFTLTGVTFASGVTNGSADVTCVMRLTAPNTALCHIEGSTVGHYINPTAATNTPGKVTLTTASTLTMTHASGTSCSLWGTGTSTLTEQTFTVTSVAGSPILNRQA